MSWRRQAYGGGVQGAFSIEVLADWPDVNRRINAGVMLGLERAAGELRADWAGRLPGSLGQSVGFRLMPPDVAVIGSTDYRARFFESGAKRHTIIPAAVAAGKAVGLQAFRAGLRGKARRELRTKITGMAYAFGSAHALRFQQGFGAARGDGIYVARVHHPGMRATHPGLNAVRQVLPGIPGIMAAAIQREL